jgi:ubiquinone/menaquinone biosynthesis C-methylase UbiE
MTFRMTRAPDDAWRDFDTDNPDPGYYQFDWLSARHPDLYDHFALSSTGLANAALELIDFSSKTVVDVGAGTGRFAAGIAPHCRRVLCVEAYEGPATFGAERLDGSNCTYVRGDRAHLPVADSSIDIVTCCWAELDLAEANRVTKPGGWVIHAGGALEEPDELTPILAPDFPALVAPLRHPDLLTPDRPPRDYVLDVSGRPDIAFVDDVVSVHDFTFVADHGDPDEAAAIYGRLFGPRSGAYLRDRRQSTVWSRQRIFYGRVAK